MALVLANHRAELNRLLQAMLTEGLVDNEFLQLQNLKAAHGRDIVIRRIIAYWRATKNLFEQMSKQLHTHLTDSTDILAWSHDLRERSNSIGAVHVSIGAVHVSVSCLGIINGCQQEKIDWCKQELITTAKMEFARLQVKFESIVKLERNIIDCEDSLEARD